MLYVSGVTVSLCTAVPGVKWAGAMAPLPECESALARLPTLLRRCSRVQALGGEKDGDVRLGTPEGIPDTQECIHCKHWGPGCCCAAVPSVGVPPVHRGLPGWCGCDLVQGLRSQSLEAWGQSLMERAAKRHVAAPEVGRLCRRAAELPAMLPPLQQSWRLNSGE